MTIVAYDPIVGPRSAAWASFPEVRFVASLQDVLGEAHAVSLHLPLTEATRGIIGHEQIASIRHGSYLINVSRGALIDQGALRQALASGHLAGAALDVLSPEPSNWDDPLLGERNLVLTPRIGYLSETSLAQCQIDAALEVRRLLTGAPAQCPVVWRKRDNSRNRLTAKETIMAQRPTPSQLLAGIIGLGLIGIGATKLTSCGVSSSSVAATNQAVQSLVVTPTPTAVVDAGCITCVARATEEARSGPANETGSGR